MPAHPRSMKHLVIAVGAGLLLIGVIGVVVLRTTGIGAGGLQGASDRLEDWIGSQIVGVANSYLVPQIGYTDIDFQAPGTVMLAGVTFTAPDGTTVLELAGMTVTLAEIPKIGEPIVIDRLVFDHATARLIREARPDGTAGFKGLSPIVKNSPTRDDDVESNFKLSNVLRLRQVEFIEGSLVYDSGDGAPVMTIDGLSTTINAAPDEGQAGWYTLDIDSAVGPLAELSLDGLINLDSFTARVDRLHFGGRLTPESVGILPPQLQTLVRQYEATGRVDLTASGEVPLTDPLAGALEIELELADFRVASGDYQVPIESISAQASLAGGVATLSKLSANMLGGSVRANAEADLTADNLPASAFWTIDNLELQDLLLANTEAEGPPKLAGKLIGSGRLTTRLDDPRGSLDGSGELHLREGRVLVLPGLTQLADLMHVAASADAAEEAMNHTIDAEFNLGPAGLDFTSSEVTTEFLVARGTGTLGFDGSLDMAVNGGPMEKLQSLLGGLGEVLGSVTDKLVKYRVRGTVAAPEVSVDPLGLGG
jgi:hypothetical protein